MMVFAPMENLFGFDMIDLIGLFLAIILAAGFLTRTSAAASARYLANRPVLCMLLLAALTVVLRLALLPRHPVPTPRVADDFSYLLLGDTLAHFRLANPEHPMRRFFEGVFVLQQPSWSSIYPLGQGLALAAGELLFRLPWTGVVLSIAGLCALCYWMLRAWVSPAWALAGGLLAVAAFGPLCSWMNNYWGGAVSGIAGCLVFGALPRLRKLARTRDAVLLGLGLGLQLLTRPFEFLVLVPIVLLFLVPIRSLAIAALVLMPAFGLTLLQNKRVTGSWTTLPYQLSRYQYGVPTTFSFQPNPAPHRALTVEQQIDYEAQTAAHNDRGYFHRLGERVQFFRFFFLPPLYLVLPAFLLALRESRFILVVAAIAVVWLADGSYPYFYPHYVAVVAPLFILVSVKGLEQLSRFRIGVQAASLILMLCFAHFAWSYGAAALERENDPEGRIAINRQLEQASGKQLVFVRYWPRHGPHEWIQNAADIDNARVVWAIDLGAQEDQTLRRYYPDRHAWLLEPDARPPRLTPIH